MRTLLAIAALVLALLGPGHARAETGPRAVISDQLAAFLADDLGTAFSFASPGIRALFGTPGNFGLMVEQGYPMVWRPGEVAFVGRAEQGGAVLEQVRITDRAGAVHYLEYRMIPTDDGWKIDGVRFIEAPFSGV